MKTLLAVLTPQDITLLVILQGDCWKYWVCVTWSVFGGRGGGSKSGGVHDGHGYQGVGAVRGHAQPSHQLENYW